MSVLYGNSQGLGGAFTLYYWFYAMQNWNRYKSTNLIQRGIYISNHPFIDAVSLIRCDANKSSQILQSIVFLFSQFIFFQNALVDLDDAKLITMFKCNKKYGSLDANICNGSFKSSN